MSIYTYLFIAVITLSSMNSAFADDSVNSGSLSYRAKKQEDVSPFGFSLVTSYQSPFDPVEGYADPKMITDIGVSYKIDSKQSLSFRTRYFQVMVKEYDDPNYNGFLNSDFGYSNNEIWTNKSKDLSLGYAVGVTLPTSQSSQIAGLRVGPWANISIVKMWKFLRFSITNQVGINNFRYDTADSAGETFNEGRYWFTNVSVGTSFGPRNSINWSIGGTNYTGWNLGGGTNRNYGLSTSLNYMITRNYGINAMIGSQDQRSENTNMFLYDRMFWTLGIVVSI